MDDEPNKVWFENNVTESDCTDLEGQPDGWYTHLAYPIWKGYNPYVLTSGELYEVGEDGYILIEEADRVRREEFFLGKKWYPITMKFWYGPKDEY